MTAEAREESSGSAAAPAPRVSLGMPLYNAAEYLPLTLDSLLGQSFRDFELIISDNGSTDATAEICRTRLADDPRIRFFRQPENRGAAVNYNFTLEKARGAYFKWAAYDDLLDRRFLEACVTALDADEGVVLAYPRTLIINEKGRVIADYDDRLDLVESRAGDRLAHLVRNLALCNPVFGLMRRTALLRTRRHGAFNEADRITLAEMALEGRFKEIPERLFLRRLHPGISTARSRDSKEVADWFDPANRGKLLHMPKARLFAEHLFSIGRSGLPAGEKLHCLRSFLAARAWRWWRDRERRRSFGAEQARYEAEKRRQAAQAGGQLRPGEEVKEEDGMMSDQVAGEAPAGGSDEEARAWLRQTLRDAQTHHRQRRLEPALAGYDAVLERFPEHLDSLHLKGAALAEAGRRREAVKVLERAFAARPETRTSKASRQRALRAIGLAGTRATAEGAAYAESPAALEPLLAWGLALLRLQRYEEAWEFFEHAGTLVPDSAEAALQGGAALEHLDRPEEAYRCYVRAARLDPKLGMAHGRIGRMLNQRKDYKNAIMAFGRALELQPDNSGHLGSLVMVKRIVCDWRDDADLLARLKKAVAEAWKDRRQAPINPSFAQNLDFSMAELRALAELNARALFRDLKPIRDKLAFSFEDRAKPKDVLRVGYMSEGFRNFPTSHLIRGLFGQHDRKAVEVYVYSYGPDDRSSYRRDIAAGADRFVDIRDLDEIAAARQIHDDGIDILVDLKGYTIHARPRITALRPAPVQVNYLGYPGTWGCKACDYVLVDRTVVPDSDASYFNEALVHLPDCYQVTDDEQPVAQEEQRRADHGLPEEGFVFCCFNKPFKFDPDIFSTWMRILEKKPGSVLWLIDDGALTQENLRREAEARGIDPDRLVFAPKRRKPLHLARHVLADLFLDTRIYTAHTTATDALWMGLPLITCPGRTFAGRVAASLLRTIGLPDLVVPDYEAYEALALKLANDPEALSQLRRRLAEGKKGSPVFDTARFARGLEAAYRRMWENYCTGQHPRPIALTEADLKL